MGACRHSINAAVPWYQLLVSRSDWLNRWLMTALRKIFDRSWQRFPLASLANFTRLARGILHFALNGSPSLWVAKSVFSCVTERRGSSQTFPIIESLTGSSEVGALARSRGLVGSNAIWNSYFFPSFHLMLFLLFKTVLLLLDWSYRSIRNIKRAYP